MYISVKLYTCNFAACVCVCACAYVLCVFVYALVATCSGGGNAGCSPPVGDKWDRWDMAGSTYAYCYAGCHMPWFMNNSQTGAIKNYAGVVGVDHYWTGQGVPCDSNGDPNEFDMQDSLSQEWKRVFPGMRFLSYRILSAVPYDKVVVSLRRDLGMLSPLSRLPCPVLPCPAMPCHALPCPIHGTCSNERWCHGGEARHVGVPVSADES